MMPMTPKGDGCTSAFRPNSRAARISLAARIHCGTCDLVCSITEIMPRTSVNSDPRLGSRAEVRRHGVDERVGIVEYEREQPVDAIASNSHARRPLSRECLPLTFEDRLHRRAPAVERVVDPLLGCAHDHSSSDCLVNQNCLLSTLLSSVR
jgi:hypothetical protein